MKTLVKAEPMTVAANLYAVQAEIATLKEREDEYKAELLANMKEQGVKTVKLEDGTYFMRMERETLKVDESDKKAKDWLDDNYCWKPDTSKALKLVRRSLKKMPKFFSISTTEYLAVKRPNQNANED